MEIKPDRARCSAARHDHARTSDIGRRIPRRSGQVDTPDTRRERRADLLTTAERVQYKGYLQREHKQSCRGPLFLFCPLSLGGKRVHMS